MKYILVCFLFLTGKMALANAPLYTFQDIDSLKQYRQMANSPSNQESLAKAYVYFDKKRLEALALKDTAAIISHLRQIAIIQNKLGDYFGSESSVVEAIKLLDKCEVSKQTIKDKVGLLNQLGRINMELLDYNAAIQYFDEALNITPSKNYINIIQNNKALVYMQQERYEQAEKEFLNVYNNSVLTENIEQIARALDNLGFVQSKLNRPLALNKIHDALKLRISIDDHAGTYASYKHLSLYYQDHNDAEKARDYGNKAYSKSIQINSPSFIKDALSNLIHLDLDSNALKYIQITDSISKAHQIQENKYAKVKYDYSEKEKLAKANELEKEKQKRLKLLYLGVIVFVMLLSLFILFFLKIKHKRDKIKEVYLTETRISKKVHDEVANDVYQVMNKLQVQATITEDVLDDLEHIYSRTRDISKENSTVEVDEHFEILLEDLLLSFKNNQVNIIIQNISKINWTTLENIKKITVYRVLQELMVNMKKHSEASLVVLSFSQINTKINMVYVDNGKGCTLKKGNGGLQNVENRIKSIKGAIIFESETNKGFKAKISV